MPSVLTSRSPVSVATARDVSLRQAIVLPSRWPYSNRWKPVPSGRTIASVVVEPSMSRSAIHARSGDHTLPVTP